MSDVVHNARVTLLANLLNTMAGISFGAGVAAPIAATFYGGALAGTTLKSVVIGAIIWLAVCFGLHGFAQAVLGRLR